MNKKTIIQVLHFTPDSSRSMERFLLELAEQSRNQGYRTVHVFAGEPCAAFRDQLHALDSPYKVARFPLTRETGSALGRELRQFQPFLIQTHFLSKFDPCVKLLKTLSGAELLFVADQSSGRSSTKTGAAKLASRVRGWWAGTYIDQIIAVSEFVKNRDIFDVHFPKNKTRLVYNGVDTRRFSPQAPIADEIAIPDRGTDTDTKAETETERNPVFTIAFVGQLIPEKGVRTLLYAARILKDQGLRFRLRIAGRGGQGDELRDFCTAADLTEIVEFLGQVPNTEHQFRTADIVVVPSEWEEAFGFVAAEAAACGACLVVSDAGALPEIVGRDEHAGRIFPKGNAQVLSEVLRQLIASPEQRASLRHAARIRAVTLFSLESMVQGYLQCLLDLRNASQSALPTPSRNSCRAT